MKLTNPTPLARIIDILWKKSRQQPENGECRKKMGSILVKRRDMDRALVIYRELLLLYPSNLTIKMSFVLILCQCHLFPEAIKKLREILSIFPEYSKAYLVLSEIYARLGDEGAYLNTIGRAMKFCPQDSKFHQFAATFFKKKKKFHDAINCYQTALKINPHHQENLFNLGICLFQDKRFKECIEVFSNLNSREKGNFEVLFFLAQSYYFSHRFNKAKKHLVDCLQKAPESLHAKISMKIAMCEKKTGNFDKAIILLERLAEQEQSREIYEKLAEIFHHIGDFREEIYYRELILKHTKGSHLKDDAFSYINTLMLMNEASRAYTLLLKLIERFPGEYCIHHMAGEISFKQMRFGQALNHYKKASLINPASLPVNFGLARSYEQTGDKKNQKKYLKLVLKENKKHSEALFNLGRLLLEEKNFIAAEKIFYKIAQNSGKEKYRAKARYFLQHWNEFKKAC
ncbi:tetratricopeptide repeat protein [Candidatus Riflebacteria bacterium]